REALSSEDAAVLGDGVAAGSRSGAADRSRDAGRCARVRGAVVRDAASPGHGGLGLDRGGDAPGVGGVGGGTGSVEEGGSVTTLGLLVDDHTVVPDCESSRTLR